MTKIIAILENTGDNLSASLYGIDGIKAVGYDMNELEHSLKNSIEVYLKSAKENGDDVPKELQGEYEIEYLTPEEVNILEKHSAIISIERKKLIGKAVKSVYDSLHSCSMLKGYDMYIDEVVKNMRKAMEK